MVTSRKKRVSAVAAALVTYLALMIFIAAGCDNGAETVDERPPSNPAVVVPGRSTILGAINVGAGALSPYTGYAEFTFEVPGEIQSLSRLETVFEGVFNYCGINAKIRVSPGSTANSFTFTAAGKEDAKAFYFAVQGSIVPTATNDRMVLGTGTVSIALVNTTEGYVKPLSMTVSRLEEADREADFANPAPVVSESAGVELIGADFQGDWVYETPAASADGMARDDGDGGGEAAPGESGDPEVSFSAAVSLSFSAVTVTAFERTLSAAASYAAETDGSKPIVVTTLKSFLSTFAPDLTSAQLESFLTEQDYPEEHRVKVSALLRGGNFDVSRISSGESATLALGLRYSVGTVSLPASGVAEGTFVFNSGDSAEKADDTLTGTFQGLNVTLNRR